MKQKNGKIELLRFLFAVVIMLLHAGNIAGFENVLFKTGAFGVEFFFLVSGYLMVASVERKAMQGERLPLGTETVQFLKKKVVAIYPEVVISWLLAIGVYTAAKELQTVGVLELMINSLGDLLLVKASGLQITSINGVVWYVSAMLIVMAVLYPLLRKHKNIMLRVVLPLAAVLAFGYLRQEAGTLRKPDQWLGLCTRGLPRALAEISIGAVCYPLCQKLKGLKLSTLGRALCTVVEWGIYIFIFLYMHFGTSTARDYFYVMLLAVAVVLTFSQQSLDAKWFNNKLCYWLGKFSLSIFLSHAAWCKTMDLFAPKSVSVQYKVTVYIIMSLVSAVFVYWLGAMWRKVSPVLKGKCKKYLLTE